MSELVARKIQDFQSPIPIFIIKFLQSFVLRCKSASGSSVYNQKNLSLILCHRHFLALGVTYVEVINFHKITFRFYAIKLYATKL